MKYKSVNIFEADKLLEERLKCVKWQIDGKWVAHRPIGYSHFLHRIRCAWEVFQGRADIVKWYKQ